MKVVHILLNDTCYILKLGKLVTVVLCEHTLWADDLMAELAEVLNLFFRVATAIDFGSLGMRAQTSYKCRGLLLLLEHPFFIFLTVGHLRQRLALIVSHLISVVLSIHPMVALNLKIHLFLIFRECLDNFKYLIVGDQGLGIAALDHGPVPAEAALYLAGVSSLCLELLDAFQAEGVATLGQDLGDVPTRIEQGLAAAIALD